GIGRYARNQTALSDRIEGLQGELASLDPQEDDERMRELEEVLIWQARIFTERAQALTYVCETPVLLEQRAFAIARALAAQLVGSLEMAGRRVPPDCTCEIVPK